MKLSKSQQRLLDKLRSKPKEELTEEEKEDLEELEQLEKEEEKTEGDDLSAIKNGMEEILKWLKTQETKTTEKVEIPTPQPVITNQDLEDQDQKPQESKMKKLLKALW